MGSWSGKTVLVTGGSAGLGVEIVAAFAAAGATVVALARNSERLEEAVGGMRERDWDVRGETADVLIPEQVEQAVQRAVSLHGQLDVFVNNVGRSVRGRACDTTPEEFQEFWEGNFLSIVRCTRIAIPHLIQSQGHLVNIGSLAAKVGGKHLGAYPASKFPLAAYSQQLRLELAEHRVHVLLACPGPLKRDDGGQRYESSAANLPPTANQPGGGVRISGLDGAVVGRRIVKCCERRRPELVMPSKAKLLFALAQISPAFGDWILKKMTK